MKQFSLFSAILLHAVLLTGCMKWDYTEKEELSAPGHGLYITCEGNFQYGNASLSYYDPQTNTVQNNVFVRANGYKLGDVAQSMTMYGGKGWIVVNNSHVIFAIDPDNFKETGRIVNLTSPRYIHFIDNEKAYVTQLWDNRIFIVNPSTYSITGYIQVPGMSMESGSTEQMTAYGKYLFVNCWSYQNRILKIDTTTDEIVGEVVVGIQPKAIAIDRNGKLWTLTDGGYEGSPYGYEAPQLIRINPETLEIERSWQFNIGDSPNDLQLNGNGDMLYWINDDVWCMDIDSETIPAEPFLNARGTIYYGMTIDPERGDVYVADAIDYQQPGMIYRYSDRGILIDEFYTGVIPGSFCWK